MQNNEDFCGHFWSCLNRLYWRMVGPVWPVLSWTNKSDEKWKIWDSKLCELDCPGFLNSFWRSLFTKTLPNKFRVFDVTHIVMLHIVMLHIHIVIFYIIYTVNNYSFLRENIYLTMEFITTSAEIQIMIQDWVLLKLLTYTYVSYNF